jgi:hypothetical protein
VGAGAAPQEVAPADAPAVAHTKESSTAQVEAAKEALGGLESAPEGRKDTTIPTAQPLPAAAPVAAAPDQPRATRAPQEEAEKAPQDAEAASAPAAPASDISSQEAPAPASPETQLQENRGVSKQRHRDGVVPGPF